MNIEPAAALVSAIADVSEAMIELSRLLQAEPGVATVRTPQTIRREERIGTDQFTVGSGSGARIEWFSSADFSNGIGVSFMTSLAWPDREWTIEGAVTANDLHGEHTLAELPTRYATDVLDAVIELRGQAPAVGSHLW
jgi:hypothetical protein